MGIFLIACIGTLFICGLGKAVSGYGIGTGLACMFLSVCWALYAFTPYMDPFMAAL